ncbi:inner membrane protein [Citrobacter braakii]|nr:inner membrane protein [Citrobacter braakii]
MWVLLRSQDSSLLLGTGVLLFALCGVMFLTRHLDWHSLAQPKPKPKSTELPELQPAQSDEFRLWK